MCMWASSSLIPDPDFFPSRVPEPQNTGFKSCPPHLGRTRGPACGRKATPGSAAESRWISCPSPASCLGTPWPVGRGKRIIKLLISQIAGCWHEVGACLSYSTRQKRNPRGKKLRTIKRKNLEISCFKVLDVLFAGWRLLLWLGRPLWRSRDW